MHGSIGRGPRAPRKPACSSICAPFADAHASTGLSAPTPGQRAVIGLQHACLLQAPTRAQARGAKPIAHACMRTIALTPITTRTNRANTPNMHMRPQTPARPATRASSCSTSSRASLRWSPSWAISGAPRPSFSLDASAPARWSRLDRAAPPCLRVRPAPAKTQRVRAHKHNALVAPLQNALVAHDSYADAWQNFTTRMSGALSGKYTGEHRSRLGSTGARSAGGLAAGWCSQIPRIATAVLVGCRRPRLGIGTPPQRALTKAACLREEARPAMSPTSLLGWAGASITGQTEHPHVCHPVCMRKPAGLTGTATADPSACPPSPLQPPLPFESLPQSRPSGTPGAASLSRPSLRCPSSAPTATT